MTCQVCFWWGGKNKGKAQAGNKNRAEKGFPPGVNQIRFQRFLVEVVAQAEIEVMALIFNLERLVVDVTQLDILGTKITVGKV